LYIAISGGGSGEVVNHTFEKNGLWEVADVSQDNLNRFNEWVAQRGIATPGYPPIIQGPGIDWPHPDFNQPLGVEFARFTTYGIYKYYKNMVDAVKSVSDIPCLYQYSVSSNRQFRAIANPNMNFIASAGDGMYGSDGDGPGDLTAKIKVNSVNLGTFPNGISATEIDADDISPARNNFGRMPKYCEGNLQYGTFLDIARNLYSRGLRFLLFAMAYCPDEIRGFEPVLRPLHEQYIGRDYVRPLINAANTVTVEVTEKYRASQDLMEAVDPYTTYTRYTDCNFWGPKKPEGATNCETSSRPIDSNKLTGYLDNNLDAYGGNVLLDINKPGQTVYSYSKGNIGRNDPKSVMSISKGVTAATLMTFYDEGRIGMDDKVSKFIPSWKRSDKENITIRHVVSHTSGIRDETNFEGAKTLEEAVDGMSNTQLDFAPGTQFRYSTTSYQVLARIAEIIAGKNFEQIFNERIRYKCNMLTAGYNPENPRNPLAGYGLYASQSDMSNFAAMLRDNGLFNSQQVLSPKAIALLRTNMTGGLGNWGFGFILDGSNLVSESAKGLSLFVKPGICSYTLMTQSTYEATIGANNGLRELFKSML
ncbi:beta-lactamase family protein, partial [Dyadobacter sp. CY261]|uniref:serine hydrolase domain-containing protein n=1 Tax=Dyadobacter sp. CY261 TaxID=2907203 RepID=UPI001F1ECB48